MADWKNISLEFNEKLQKQWENKNFSYKEVEKWIKFGGLEPAEADFAQWLRDIKKLGPKSILNKENLENEYAKKTTPPKKRLRVEIDKESIQKELFGAIKNNDVEKAKKIIEEGKINAKDTTYDEDKFTPLHLAVARNQKEVVIKLLKNGANPDVKDSEGNTPLHFAARKGNLPMLKLLVEYGGNINSVNEYNWSILHSAASGIINEKEDWDIIEWLLEQKKIDINIEDENNLTVRDVFFQKDYSYVKNYDKLVERVFLQSNVLHRE